MRIFMNVIGFQVFVIFALDNLGVREGKLKEINFNILLNFGTAGTSILKVLWSKTVRDFHLRRPIQLAISQLALFSNKNIVIHLEKIFVLFSMSFFLSFSYIELILWKRLLSPQDILVYLYIVHDIILRT